MLENMENFGIFENNINVAYVGMELMDIEKAKKDIKNKGFKEFTKDCKVIKLYNNDIITSYQNEKYIIDIVIVNHGNGEIQELMDIYVKGSNKINDSQYQEILNYCKENF